MLFLVVVHGKNSACKSNSKFQTLKEKRNVMQMLAIRCLLTSFINTTNIFYIIRHFKTSIFFLFLDLQLFRKKIIDNLKKND